MFPASLTIFKTVFVAINMYPYALDTVCEFYPTPGTVLVIAVLEIQIATEPATLSQGEKEYGTLM